MHRLSILVAFLAGATFAITFLTRCGTSSAGAGPTSISQTLSAPCTSTLSYLEGNGSNQLPAGLFVVDGLSPSAMPSLSGMYCGTPAFTSILSDGGHVDGDCSSTSRIMTVGTQVYVACGDSSETAVLNIR